MNRIQSKVCMSHESSRNWSILILCTGYGNETLRSLVARAVSKLGFEVHVYDSAGYPVDTQVHSHEACVRAIDQHDIVLAFADERQGGTFARWASSPEGVPWLDTH